MAVQPPKMNVLVADDDAVTRLLLGFCLGKLGHAVSTANNGREAWGRMASAIIVRW